jgi:hypothetical protein
MDAKRIAAFGRSGVGKSTIMDAIAAPAERLIVFDFLPTGAIRAKKLKLQHVLTIGEVRDIMARKYHQGFRLWYQPPQAGQITALHELSMLIWRVQETMGDALKGYPHLTLMVDEMKGCFPVYSLPSHRQGFYNLCTAGRHIGVNLVGGSQRPAQVNTEFRGNLDACYLFSLVTDADHQAAKAIGGARCAEFVRTAPKYRYVRIGEGGQLTFGETRR